MKTAPVPDFPGYRATSDGWVETCKQFKGAGYGRRPSIVLGDEWRRLLPTTDKRGRRRFTLSRNGKTFKIRASRLVLEAFVGPCPPGLECCHENGNETDDRLENLRWDTHSRNLMDRRKHGTVPCGDKSPRHKLTSEQVLEIRRVGYPLKQHSEKYNVTEAVVSQILRRKIWTHI